MREVLRIIFAIGAVLSLAAIGITALTIDNCNNEVQGSKGHINACKSNIDQNKEILEEQEVFLAMLSACKVSSDSSIAQFDEIIPIYIETSTAKIVNLQEKIQNSEESIAESKLMIQTSESNAEFRRDIRWIFTLILIGMACSFVIFGCIPYDEWWDDLRDKMLNNPSKVYVVTKTKNNGDIRYMVVVARWWFKREKKSFETQAQAHDYALILKRENLVSHWHEVKG